MRASRPKPFAAAAEIYTGIADLFEFISVICFAFAEIYFARLGCA